MIPTGGGLQNAPVETVEQPSLTYRLDLAKGRVIGNVNGLEAIKQAVYKILQSSRFSHEIYSFNYGHEMRPMIGQNPLYVKSEVTRLITEGLTQDDRIQGIEGLEMDVSADSMTVTFTVVSTLGEFNVTQEVN